MKNLTLIDGKEILYLKSNDWDSVMKNERLKRREPVELTCSIADQQMDEKLTKKQIGIVKPLFFSQLNEKSSEWNYSELEKLEKRCSELIDQEKCSVQELIERIQSLYSSMACQVFLSPSLVRLYQLTDREICSFEQWKYLSTGYPMWIYNNGQNPRRSMELHLFIVDRRTGFILWSNPMTKQSNFIRRNHSILSFRHSSLNSFFLITLEEYHQKHFFEQFISFYQQKSSFIFNSKKTFFTLEKRKIRKSEISSPFHLKHFNHFQSVSFH